MIRTRPIALAAMALALTAPAPAFEISGDVEQSATLGHLIASDGPVTHASNYINTLSDCGDIRGNVKQTVKAGIVMPTPTGSRTAHCADIKNHLESFRSGGNGYPEASPAGE
ncbi:hypothetical protein [Thiocystis violacea]|uniref:hypothetical protein n=1 Tax=Thiocystis violacea TaxID=13725 RepID=UPI001908D3F5|nr:hypothetical protein [Thiocystis violacea]MBK1720092.1 hypothetical protein [Thiocystis violacea]